MDHVDLDEVGDNLPAMDLGPRHTVKEIAVGVSHTCAVFTDGALMCWEFAEEFAVINSSGSEVELQTDLFLRPSHVPTAADLDTDSATVRVFRKDPDALCSICLQPPLQDTELLATTCGHVFHRACLRPWLAL